MHLKMFRDCQRIELVAEWFYMLQIVQGRAASIITIITIMYCIVFGDVN